MRSSRSTGRSRRPSSRPSPARGGRKDPLANSIQGTPNRRSPQSYTFATGHLFGSCAAFTPCETQGIGREACSNCFSRCALAAKCRAVSASVGWSTVVLLVPFGQRLGRGGEVYFQRSASAPLQIWSHGGTSVPICQFEPTAMAGQAWDVRRQATGLGAAQGSPHQGMGRHPVPQGRPRGPQGWRIGTLPPTLEPLRWPTPALSPSISPSIFPVSLSPTSIS